MKILLVTRGSQGDVYPYLTLATTLVKRGHEVTLSLPDMFEREARFFGLNYVLQEMDDIGEMMNEAARARQKTRHLLKWMRRVIDLQFEQLIPLLEQHDLLIASNTEFSAASVAEYCGKPLIRTAFAPLIPGKHIPPPVMRFSKPHPIFKPAFLWKLLNRGTNFSVKKTVNRNRVARGMAPIGNFGIHAVSYSENFLMYSRYLGNTDPAWKYKWNIGGYCFLDNLRYWEETCTAVINFIRQDERPTLFFTLGSCNDANRNRFCERLLALCLKHHYKLVVGAGWSGTGTHLIGNDTLYVLKQDIPHSRIFPYCTAVIHHGGCGTTHSAARAGVPQMIVPLILDQYYWSYRVSQTGTGPGSVSISKTSRHELEEKLTDLVTNPDYKTNAQKLSEKMKQENGPDAFCEHIETHYGK